MRRIKTISAQILKERAEETATLIAAGDNTLRRDIMSLLVEARLRGSKDGFEMDDGMMMEHFVRQHNSYIQIGHIWIIFFVSKLTFLGAGHETTASGIAWVILRLVPVSVGY